MQISSCPIFFSGFFFFHYCIVLYTSSCWLASYSYHLVTVDLYHFGGYGPLQKCDELSGIKLYTKRRKTKQTNKQKQMQNHTQFRMNSQTSQSLSAGHRLKILCFMKQSAGVKMKLKNACLTLSKYLLWSWDTGLQTLVTSSI